jgi:nicotinamide-nucleotide amidase
MGTACGIFLEQDDTSIYAFPGVPREFDAMVEEYVRPLLLGKSSWEEKKIWTWGWGESQQKEAFQGITIPVPFIFSSLPRAQGVVLSLGYPVSNDPDDSNTSLAIQHEALWKEIVRCIPKGCIVDLDGKNVLESIQETLLKQKACVATAESCTGGYIGQLLTSVPGISSVYKEGYITYSNKSKETLLGVNAKTLELYGAVSQETVAEMAVGTLKKSAAQYACAVSGIAGPGGGSDTKPVGTVWMAVGSAHDVITEKCVFWGNREEIRRKSAYYTLHLLQKYLLKK